MFLCGDAGARHVAHLWTRASMWVRACVHVCVRVRTCVCVCAHVCVIIVSGLSILF